MVLLLKLVLVPSRQSADTSGMQNLRTRLMASIALVVVSVAAAHAQGAQPPLSGHAAELYRLAEKQGHFFKDAQKIQPEIRQTSDGKAFVAIWRPKVEPARWVVSLPGTEGFATDVMALWQPIVRPYDIGLIAVQWWMGSGSNAGDYYSPSETSREIDAALQYVRAQPGMVMFHGFSRGSSNSYAIVALDATKRKYFSLSVADSGGPQLNYPPTRAISDGTLGPRPLAGTRWITSAGARDPHPDRDGVAGMRKAAEWLKEQGAIVLLSIEDARGGHGALQHSPANLKQVMELFTGR